VWFKHPAWRPVAWLLSLLNVGATWFAAAPGEPWHATAHALLAVAFGVGAQRLAHRHQLAATSDDTEALRELEARVSDLDRLQGVQGRLPELEERLDFIERALIEVRNKTHAPPRK